MNIGLHVLDPFTRRCVGCGIDDGDFDSVTCPAFYLEIADIGETLLIVITTDERLRLIRTCGSVLIGRDAMFDLRDAIDDGIRQLRKSGRSTALS